MEQKSDSVWSVLKDGEAKKESMIDSLFIVETKKAPIDSIIGAVLVTTLFMWVVCLKG